MFSSMTVQAPAKINIGLHILPKRSDGFHNLESVFTTVNLCDTIQTTLTNQKGVCSVECKEMVLPAENTITASYKAFCVLTGYDGGCNVKVTKRIPSGGGLGGGSSNASSFIQSMNILCGTQLSAVQLNQIAGFVGSDVYFFTNALIAGADPFNGKNFGAYVTGRGENVEQISMPENLNILLVFPGVQVSTKEAYSLADEHGLNCNIFGKSFFEQQLESSSWNLVNDFTVPVVKKFPAIAEALLSIKNCGADYAEMSGSGATVFGVFRNRKKAVEAQKKLSVIWKTVLC